MPKSRKKRALNNIWRYFVALRCVCRKLKRFWSTYLIMSYVLKQHALKASEKYYFLEMSYLGPYSLNFLFFLLLFRGVQLRTGDPPKLFKIISVDFLQYPTKENRICAALQARRFQLGLFKAISKYSLWHPVWEIWIKIRHYDSRVGLRTNL